MQNLDCRKVLMIHFDACNSGVYSHGRIVGPVIFIFEICKYRNKSRLLVFYLIEITVLYRLFQSSWLGDGLSTLESNAGCQMLESPSPDWLKPFQCSLMSQNNSVLSSEFHSDLSRTPALKTL